MAPRPVHFEIHADDVPRAVGFYGAVFGWRFEDWREFAGMPCFGATTGGRGTLVINGAIMVRQGNGAGPGAPVNGAVRTLGGDDFDAVHTALPGAGGTVALAGCALPGMARQG